MALVIDTGRADNPTAGTINPDSIAKGDGTKPLNPDLFNGNHPHWVISGGGASTAETKIVLENVRTALNKICEAHSNSIYDGANGYIDLTLTDVTEVPMQDDSCGVFQDYQQLRSITLPAATDIGYLAFGGCYSLTTVSLPVTTNVGIAAFMFCTALTTVTLPAATNIGINAFGNCHALVTLTLPAATSIGEFAFSGCHSLTTVSLPAATDIGRYVFLESPVLTTLRLTAAGNITLVDDAFSKRHYGDPSTDCDRCALILNPDKAPDAIADITPKVNAADATWFGLKWASITYQQ